MLLGRVVERLFLGMQVHRRPRIALDCGHGAHVVNVRVRQPYGVERGAGCAEGTQ